MADRSSQRDPRRRLERRADEEVERDPPPQPRFGRQTGFAAGVSSALLGPEYQRVKESWAEAIRARDPRLPEFIRALEAHARHARDTATGVADVLQSLNAIIRPERGGEPALDWDHMREIAGKVVIRAYYRDD